MKKSGLRNRYGEFLGNWDTLSLYERFEQAVALFLTVLIAVIVVVAAWDLARDVFFLVWRGSDDALDLRVFRNIFGRIMVLLIALEFKHSIIRAMPYRESVIQVKTVVLVAILAVARKFIILDEDQHSPLTILALAAVAGTLGLTYWLIRDRDARKTGP